MSDFALMAAVSIPSTVTATEVSSASGTGPWQFNFAWFEKADIIFRVGGVEMAQSAFTVANWTEGDGGVRIGGELTPSVALANQDLFIGRRVTPQRLNDFATGGATPSAINADLDRLAAVDVDQQDQVDRSLKVNPGETPPTVSAAVLASLLAGGLQSGVEDAIYNTRSALELATGVTGNLIRLLGYSSTLDGGGAFFKRVGSEPSHDGKIQDGDGNWYEYHADEIGRKVANLRAFGALGDGVNAGTDMAGNWTGTDDADSMLDAGNVAEALGYPVLIPIGNFITTKSLTRADALGLQTSSNVTWIGEDRDRSVIVAKFVMGPFDNLWGYIGVADAETSTTVTLASDVAKGGDIMSVNDASLLTPGQWVEIINHSESVFNPLIAGPIYAADDIQAVADGITSSTINFTSDSRYAAGKWIFVGGNESGRWRFASGIGSTWAKIQSVTAGKVSFVAGTFDAGWLADTGSGKTIRVRFADSATCRVGYPAQILAIDETTDEVRLFQSHEFDMEAYSGIDADSGLPRGTTIRRFTAPAENFYFGNFTVTQHQFPYADNASNPTTDIDLRSNILHFVRCLNVNVHDITFLYPQSYECELTNCINFAVTNTRHYSLDYDGTERYKVYTPGSHFGFIERCKMFGGRHFNDSNRSTLNGIESSHVTIENCLVSGSYGAGFGTHFGARDYSYDHCRAIGNHLANTLSTGPGQAGFQPRGREMRITNCEAHGYERGAYLIYVDDCVVKGCNFDNNEIGIEVSGADKITIVLNDFDENEEHDIYINNDGRYNAMGGLNIQHNSSKSRPSAGAYDFSGSASATIDWGAIWIFNNNVAPFAATKYTGIPLDEIHLPNRTGGVHEFFSDEVDKEMIIAPGSSTFQRARFATGYNNLSVMVNGVGGTEVARFELDRLTSYFPLELPSYTVAELTDLAASLDTGTIARCSNGKAGSPCLAMLEAGGWEDVATGSAISAT